ncbi:MAG: aspartate kinase [Bacteroidales bacterium]|nr:aspartate kinase [Bacteroidales bacterium]
MQVYKFGGASVKSADAVRNALNIISLCDDNLVLIVSAMGKTTNALEELLGKYYSGKEFKNAFKTVFEYHFEIINLLFDPKSSVFETVNLIFNKLKEKLESPVSENYDKEYDEIVSVGEILSTTIVSYYLNENNITNKLLDAREIVETDSNFRAAKVDFEKTAINLKTTVNFNEYKVYIIQGFIASDENNSPTTLGREGSDYTAAIVANILSASELTLWKDVDGIYNADPKLIDNVIKLNEISFREATELAYFGAKVIHSKTAKPLMNKGIKLTVRSFLNYDSAGTTVGDFEAKISPLVPIFIFKNNQVLLTISAKEFEFIDERIFERIFSILNKFKIKINLMQNSALNLSICFDYNPNDFNKFLSAVGEEFNYKYNQDLTLITIRHYTEETIQKLTKGKQIKLEQKSRINAFYLVEN